MTRELRFVSADGGASLVLSFNGRASATTTATAQGPEFSVTAPVDFYMAPSLPTFLEGIAEDESSQTSHFHWSTLESELEMEATRDMLGHIYLVFQLRSPDIGSNRWWSFTGRIVLELGSMQLLCKRAQEFWNEAAT